jgi:hypothetical protein
LSSAAKIQVLAVVASSGFLASLAADTPNAWLYSGCVFTLFFLALYPMPPLSLPSTPPLDLLRSSWGKLSDTQRSNTKFTPSSLPVFLAPASLWLANITAWAHGPPLPLSSLPSS